ncbi:hypothetical protein GTQ43_02380 [Nostoc sp. KVJ3]|uniref:hypothetical protein n=1 Tax=Nostoc sp. KVJ3 TaxID=457945 RepID=UPI0022377437|nr:hypothetical protein [Nostoc sp. KVJ3]MCW5312733.1 hypothetical protein [Nostoc sp. KVJ3]
MRSWGFPQKELPKGFPDLSELVLCYRQEYGSKPLIIVRYELRSKHNASCYNEGNLPSGSPVA